jgi:hypothetical protein
MAAYFTDDSEIWIIQAPRSLPRRGRSRHPMSTPSHLPSRKRNCETLRICAYAWIISGPRLVQTQAALNDAVYGIPRIQGSEVFVLRSGRPEGVKEADIKFSNKHVRFEVSYS